MEINKAVLKEAEGVLQDCFETIAGRCFEDAYTDSVIGHQGCQEGLEGQSGVQLLQL